MRIEHLSETIRRSIERGTDHIAAAARRAAFLGGTLGGALGILLVAIGYMIGTLNV